MPAARANVCFSGYSGLAAKFKKKAEDARLPVKKAFYSGLERRYTLLAEVNEKEAEKLRARERR
jgi:hypothetical protein